MNSDSINNGNPYASALDGLELEDPVGAFFDFCRKREEIRIKREKGDSFPWLDDPIFQRGRFLNVFREDDRGSKAIIRFSDGLEKDLPLLIQSVFFSRWCNRQETIDSISSGILTSPKKLKNKMEKLNPWCNYNAYPVESLVWKEKKYSSSKFFQDSGPILRKF